MKAISLSALNMRVIFPALSAALLVALFATPYMGAATFAYALMATGLFFRKSNRFLHRKLMFSAMGIDLSLVLLLELQRSAVETVVALKLGPWQFAHVLASTLALLLYGPMIYLGKTLWEKNNPRLQQLHRGLGILTFLLRTVGFLLMFSLLDKT